MKKDKRFTYEDLGRAIDMALKLGEGERDRVEGKRDATRAILKIFEASYELNTSDMSERFNFVEASVEAILHRYEQMLYVIDNTSVWDAIDREF